MELIGVKDGVAEVKTFWKLNETISMSESCWNLLREYIPMLEYDFLTQVARDYLDNIHPDMTDLMKDWIAGEMMCQIHAVEGVDGEDLFDKMMEPAAEIALDYLQSSFETIKDSPDCIYPKEFFDDFEAYFSEE